MRKSSRRMRCRGGVTILQMILTMTLVSIIVAFSIVVVARIMEAETVMRRDGQWANIAIQLDETFRNDVHNCVNADLKDDNLDLRMSDGSRAVYRLHTKANSKTLDRQEFGPADQVVIRDSFRLPFESETVWSKNRGPLDTVFIELVIRRSDNSGGPTRRLFHGLARLKRDDGDVK